MVTPCVTLREFEADFMARPEARAPDSEGRGC
jgi:hypothetical protein